MYTLIVTARMNDVDPQGWLADHTSQRLADLLPWNWKITEPADAVAS